MNKNLQKMEIFLRFFALLLALSFFFPAARACDTTFYPYKLVIDPWMKPDTGDSPLGSLFFVLPHLFGLVFFFMPHLFSKLKILTFFSLLCVAWYAYWVFVMLKDSLWGLWLSFFSSLMLLFGGIFILKQSKREPFLEGRNIDDSP